MKSDATSPQATSRRFWILAGFVLLALGAAIAGLIRFAQVRPLSVIEIRPADGFRDAPRNTQVTMVFSRPLDEEAVEPGVKVTPPVEGFVSVAGRRAAFTPRFGFRGDTLYTVTLGPTIRDRGGRRIAGEVVSRFHTAPLRLILRDARGRLLRASLVGGEAEPVSGEGAIAMAVSPRGRIAYVSPAERALILLEPEGGASPRRLPLPSALEVQGLEWSPDDRSLVFLGRSRGSGPALGRPYLVQPDRTDAVLSPFGPQAGEIDPSSALVTEALKKSLLEIVYGRESFAITPDGGAAIVRDQNWDFAAIGLDGNRIASLGPFLAVGNFSPGGELLAVVDVNPADPALPRQVLAYRPRDGRTRALSAPDRDSHSPRFAHHGQQLVFAAALALGLPRERHYALELLDLSSGKPRLLTNPPAGESDQDPRWSPDDAWISFRRTPVGAPHPGSMWVVSTDGGPARPLPGAADARWLP